MEDIADYISQIIKNDEQIIKNNEGEVLFDIANGFVNGFFKMPNDIGSLVNKISKITENHPEFALALINNFTQQLVFKNKNLEDIAGYIFQIIKNKGINNQDLVNKIICGFVQGYLQRKGDDINNLTNEISKIIEKNKGLALGISGGFTQGCFLHNPKCKDIDSRISQIIKKNGIEYNGIEYNSNLVNDIINGFTQSCILKRRKLEDIGKGISNIINTTKGIENSQNLVSKIISGFTKGCFLCDQEWEDIGTGIYNIINTEEIKGESDLVCNIIDTFVKGCLKLRPYNIKEIAKIFSKLLDIDFGTNETKIKSKLESTLLSIENQHRTNIFTNSSNKQLSREYKKQAGTQLFYCRKKLSNERDNGKNINSSYHSPQPPHPSTNSSKNEKGPTGESSTESDQEKTKDLYAKNSRKRSNSEGKNNSSPSKRHEQQNQQDGNSRQR